MTLSQIPELLLPLAKLLHFEEVARLATTSPSTLRTLEDANHFLSSTLCTGMELFGWRPFKGALFQQLQDAMQPQRLVDASTCDCRKLSFTAPMPLALETSGTFFVRFWVCASKAYRGAPCVGIVDAAEARRDITKLYTEDACRPRQSSDLFGISCNPFSGSIHASHTCSSLKNIPGDVPEQGTEQGTSSWSAEVDGWESWEAASQDSEGSSTGIGMLISNGTLEFFRQGMERWESSGVVWDQLPAKILCCAFLSDFVGNAIVSIEQVRLNDPSSCVQMEGIVRAKLTPWTASAKA